MVEETEEEKKFKIFEKLKEIPVKIKERLGFAEKKKKTLLQRLIKPKKEKSPPLKKRIIASLPRLKEIPVRIKDVLLSFFGGIKSKFIGIKDSVVGFFLSLVNIPKVLVEKTSKVPGLTKNFIDSVVKKTRSFLKKKKEEIEESPPFVQKYLVNIKPVGKSLMVTAKKPAVFYWIKEEAKKVEKTLPVELVDKKGRIKKLKEDVLEGLDSEPLSRTLVKCIELAKLTGKYSDITWMEKELNGYGEVDRFVKVGRNYPEYRQTKTILQMSLYIKGEYSLINEEFTMPFFCVRPVHWIEEIVERCKKTGAKDIMMELSIPKELAILKDYLKEDTINVMTPISSLDFVLNGIKVRIHDFMFRITTEQIKKRRKKRHLKK